MRDRFVKRQKTASLKGERQVSVGRIIFVLVLLSFILCPLSAEACRKAKVETKPAVTLTAEQEQQFTYYWYAAKEALGKEKYDEALVLLEFCRMIKPDDGQTLTFLGMMYDGLRMPERAMQLFKQAYEADPDGQWKNYLERCMQQALKEGNWKEALKIQDEIDTHQEYDAASAYTHSQLYMLGGKPKQALAALDKYLETDPTHLPLLTLRVEILEQMKVSTKELYPAYEKVLALNPGNLMVLNNYAYHLATHGGDLKEAEKMSAVTIREEPDNAVYLDTYGWILHLQGQNELALFFLQRALNNAKEGAKEEIEKHIGDVRRTNVQCTKDVRRKKE